MSYCMFENTYKDLRDCLEALSDSSIEELEDDANDYEKPYIRKLIELCKEIAEDYSPMEDED